MNHQKNYYGIKKSSYTKKSKKNSSKGKQLNNKKSYLNPNNNTYTNKINVMNQFNNYNNQPYTVSDYFNNKKQINQMMNDYNLFVKKHFGSANLLASMSEEGNYRNNPNKNIFLEDEYNNEFQQLLKNNEDLDFGEENFYAQLPLDDEFSYSQTDQLGKHKNNCNDYARREKVLIKNEEEEENQKKKKEQREKEERRKKDGCELLFQVFDRPAKFYYSEFIQSLKQYGKYTEEKKNINATKIQKYYKAKKREEKKRRKNIGCERLFQFFYHQKKLYYLEFILNLKQYGKYIEEKKNISAKKIQEFYKAKKKKEKNMKMKEKDIKKKDGCEKLFQFFYHRRKFYYPEFIQNLIQYGEYKLYIEEKKNISAKKIQEYYKTKKRKEKLYVGFDITETMFLKIYANEYDTDRKIKSIEIKIYFLQQKKEIILIKTIKELLGKYDSISVKNIRKIMSDIIEKVCLQSDETIKLDLSDEEEEGKKKDNEKEKEQKVTQKYKEEEIVNNNENVNNEKFVIENNEEKNNDKNSNEGKNKNININNDNDSSLGDVDYKGF